jgi:hypothetical protein
MLRYKYFAVLFYTFYSVPYKVLYLLKKLRWIKCTFYGEFHWIITAFSVKYDNQSRNKFRNFRIHNFG